MDFKTKNQNFSDLLKCLIFQEKITARLCVTPFQWGLFLEHPIPLTFPRVNFVTFIPHLDFHPYSCFLSLPPSPVPTPCSHPYPRLLSLHPSPVPSRTLPLFSTKSTVTHNQHHQPSFVLPLLPSLFYLPHLPLPSITTPFSYPYPFIRFFCSSVP